MMDLLIEKMKKLAVSDYVSGLGALMLIHFATKFAYIACSAIYNVFLSPLRRIPGPWYAAASPFWINIQTLRFRRCREIESLFKEYGPVVRIAPNYVMFCNLETMRIVYGATSKFDKDPWYKSLIMNDTDHAMTTLPCGLHLQKKRGFAPHYTPTHLALFQPEIRDSVVDLLQLLEDIGGSTPVNTLTLFRALLADVMYLTLYGEGVGAVKGWSTDSEDLMAQSIGDFLKNKLVRSCLPAWFWNMIRNIPNTRWREFCYCDPYISAYIIGQVKLWRAEIRSGKVDQDLEGSTRIPLLARLLRHKIDGEDMSDAQVISECMGHTIAGIDTTSTTASYACWELSRRPPVMRKLQEELDMAMPDPHIIPDTQVLQRLPYLDACIKEVLRVYGAGPAPLPRIVPAGGMSVAGFTVPAGTTVATQSWSMHRIAGVFPDADQFNPDRWIKASPEETNVMQAHHMPFGYGPRICGGQNLSVLVLRMLLASLARNFDITAAKDTDENSTWMGDAFATFMWAGECNLIFTPRSRKE